MGSLFIICKKLSSLKLILALAICILSGACSTSYPCPGSGQMSAGDLSQFDESGNPKGKKKKGSKDNGLVNKKQPKRLNKR